MAADAGVSVMTVVELSVSSGAKLRRIAKNGDSTRRSNACSDVEANLDILRNSDPRTEAFGTLLRPEFEAVFPHFRRRLPFLAQLA